jgi:ABC-type lipopolysaccharide export system ATPase subunit
VSEANLLEARHLSKITNHRKVVDEVSLQVNRGEIVGLLGSDRVGMTTTLQMLTGNLKPDGGTVRIQGSVMTALPPTMTFSGPSILILDEPFSTGDPKSHDELKSRILRLAGQGCGVLFADADVRGALDFCDRAYVLGEGRVLASGSSAGLIGPQ